MKILPASGSEWFSLLLLPFKVFVPLGYIMVVIERQTVGYRAFMGETVPFVLNGYIVTFLVLLCGAGIQLNIGPRRACLATCGFAGALIVFGVLLLPYLAHT